MSIVSRFGNDQRVKLVYQAPNRGNIAITGFIVGEDDLHLHFLPESSDVPIAVKKMKITSLTCKDKLNPPPESEGSQRDNHFSYGRWWKNLKVLEGD